MKQHTRTKELYYKMKNISFISADLQSAVKLLTKKLDNYKISQFISSITPHKVHATWNLKY
jgi:hypothetical protein